MAYFIDPDIHVVRVEALTYDYNILNKDGELDYEALAKSGECSWKFYDVLHGTKEFIKEKLMETNYLCRVVERPGWVRRQIWEEYTNHDDKKRSVNIDKPLKFIERWRNF